MPIKLPRLTTDIDCGPIGYEGLLVTFWLNPPIVEYEPPESPETWDTAGNFHLARVLEYVTIPAEMVDGDEPLVIEVPDAEAVYELVRREDFDPHITEWAFNRYFVERGERLQAELKN